MLAGNSIKQSSMRRLDKAHPPGSHGVHLHIRAAGCEELLHRAEREAGSTVSRASQVGQVSQVPCDPFSPQGATCCPLQPSMHPSTNIRPQQPGVHLRLTLAKEVLLPPLGAAAAGLPLPPAGLSQHFAKIKQHAARWGCSCRHKCLPWVRLLHARPCRLQA